MDKIKKILLAAFILVALVQLYVPASMILGREKILAEGREFRFRSAPVDPNDPFRGKYIVLNYRDNQFFLGDTTESWVHNEDVFVVLEENEEGYAVIKDVLRTEPDPGSDYVKAQVWYVNDWNHSLTLRYPFDRFYMDEYKAPAAETYYREAVADSTQVAYALVKVKQGEAVISDVMIDGESIRDIVERKQETSSEKQNKPR